VVFFGENVPRERVKAANRVLVDAEVLLVVGSSLAVYSGYRFVLKAAKAGCPVAMVNLGPTRGDAQAQVCVDGRSGEVLPLLAEAILRHNA
jgi:NAD-dependent SIR2 family protein deacetylase